MVLHLWIKLEEREGEGVAFVEMGSLTLVGAAFHFYSGILAKI